MKSKNLQDHILAAYTNLRIGIGGLALILPFSLWAVGHSRSNLQLQDSISAYYHSGGGTTRDLFVGILCAIGAFLCLYKGYSLLEDWALNGAGIFLVGVALFPMEWNCDTSCSKWSLHGTFAILFFLSIAYVCICLASDTLTPDLMKKEYDRKKYGRIYKLLGLAMIAIPLITLLLTLIIPPGSGVRATIFWVETSGVVVFAVYWIVKSYEIYVTGTGKLAIEGKLISNQQPSSDVFKWTPVQKVKGEDSSRR
ncbi:MAG TPA: DUF998 domain-containing protein [Nostoc sp.]|uniref:DUF998 domain-containing protein n=1 Tax=Nostoc sp. TaxID=1180 RepID=UPI002D3A69C2|nr:DUF998 domain-containing protein [Nostoc sp.]HYX15108.1 DUF998 domain-containing protein [Nostoc sp.]